MVQIGTIQPDVPAVRIAFEFETLKRTRSVVPVVAMLGPAAHRAPVRAPVLSGARLAAGTSAFAPTTAGLSATMWW